MAVISNQQITALASWLDRDRAVITPAYHRYTEVVAARGEGTHLIDVDGRSFLDFTSGIGVTSIGHNHPRVVEAAQRQLATLTHVSAVTHHELNIRLCERLVELTPPGLDQCFLANSGAEVVDAAIKLARRVTGRTDIVAFNGAFHGRTIAATSLTTSKEHYRTGCEPLLGGVHHVAFPRQDDEMDLVRAELRELLWERGNQIAAIIVEPILGEGGYIVPPRAFLPLLRGLADEHGILLVADEVQTGVGRTGRFLASEHVGTVPDVLLLAKALGSGLPISALVARRELMEAWPPSAHGSTFGGNPVARAAALATLEVIEEEGLIERAAILGSRCLGRLRDVCDRYDVVIEARGLGLMLAIELRGRSSSPGAVQEQVRAACLDEGLLLISCGSHDEAIRLIPPLNIAMNDLDQGLSILENAIKAIDSAETGRDRT